jgi:nascent polypeptide-associated complex subunit alpha
MGIKTTELEVERVVVEKKDGTSLVVSPATVSMIEFQGQKTLQVAGEFSEEASAGEAGSGDDDAKMVAEQSGVSIEQAQAALEEAGGDIAQAILKLKKD